MLPKYGAKQIERGGPGTEPCGIPHERGAKEDRVAKADTESSICQVRPEPLQCYAPDAHPLFHARDQDLMVHCVKCSSEV